MNTIQQEQIMQNSTSHPQDVSPTEARQGRRRTGLLTVMGAGIALALGGMLVVYLITGLF
jgi:hypothetical protein